MVQWAKIDSYPGNSSSNALLTERPCPLCGAMQARPIFSLSDFQFYSDSDKTPKRVDVDQCICRACSALYMNPCYSQTGFATLFAEAGASYGAPRWKYENRANWLKTHIDFGGRHSVLDLGCHKGDLLAMLPKHLQKTGIDIDEKALQDIRPVHPDMTFIAADLEQVDFPVEQEVITLFHVLEHLPRPMRFLQQLRDKARSGALLALEVPVLENANDEDINSYFSVHHLTHFTVRTIRACVEAAGWQILTSEMGMANEGYRILARSGTPRPERTGGNRGTDVALLYDYLGRYHRNMARLTETIERLAPFRRCVLWGAGCHTELLYQLTPLFSQVPDREYAMVDSAAGKWGTRWRGISIDDPSHLRGVDWTDCALLISSFGGQHAISVAARELSIPPEKIFALY
jgi:SAM-dependent methyltransferase